MKRAACRFLVAAAIAVAAGGCAAARSGANVLDSEPAAAALKLGRQAYEQSRFREALEHFREAARQAPRSLGAQTYRSTAAEVLGELDEAIDAARAAAELAPSVDAQWRVASLAERMGNAALATEMLRALLARAGGEGVAEHLFRVLVETDQQDAALALARERHWIRAGADYCGLPVGGVSRETLSLLAMLRHPESADCLLGFGVSLTDGGLVRLARRVLGEVARRSASEQTRAQAKAFLHARLPDHDVRALAESLNVIGYRLDVRHQKPDDAIQAYKKAIAADPSFSWPYGNIGVVHLRQNQLDDAFPWLEKAVRVNPAHWRAQHNLGNAAARLKLYRDALTAFLAAVRLNPADASALAASGRLLLLLGQRDAGVKTLQRAVAIDATLAAERSLIDTLAERTKLAEQVLELDGTKTALPKGLTQLRAMMTRSIASTEEEVERFGPVVARSVRTDQFYALIVAGVVNDFDRDRMSRTIEWLRTPLGQRMTAMENAAHDAPTDTVDAYARQAQGSPGHAARVELIARLERAEAATHAQVDAILAVRRGVVKATNRILAPERRLGRDVIERERQSLTDQTKGPLAAYLLFTYREASADELLEYVTFIESEAGQWYAATLRTAFVGAVEIAAERATDAVLRALAEGRLPPPERL